VKGCLREKFVWRLGISSQAPLNPAAGILHLKSEEVIICRDLAGYPIGDKLRRSEL